MRIIRANNGEESHMSIQDELSVIGEKCQKTRLAIAEDQLACIPIGIDERGHPMFMFNREDRDKHGRNRLSCWNYHQADAEKSLAGYKSQPSPSPLALPAPSKPTKARASARPSVVVENVEVTE